MKTEDLISQLASQHNTPIERLPSLMARLGLFILAGAVAVIGGFVYEGIREDWAQFFLEPAYLFQNLFLLAGVGLSATAAILLSTPGYEDSKLTRGFVFAPFMLWGAQILLSATVAGESIPTHLGWACVANIAGVGAVPAVAMFLMLRKGAPLRTMSSGFFALVAAFGIGTWARLFTCTYDEWAYRMIWHYLPIFALASVGFWAGHKLLKKS